MGADVWYVAPMFLDSRALAAHLLVAIAHARGRKISLENLASAIGVRRSDVRQTMSQLHREGYVDAMKLRLTMPGLALAASLDGCKLPPLRVKARMIAAA